MSFPEGVPSDNHEPETTIDVLEVTAPKEFDQMLAERLDEARVTEGIQLELDHNLSIVVCAGQSACAAQFSGALAESDRYKNRYDRRRVQTKAALEKLAEVTFTGLDSIRRQIADDDEAMTDGSFKNSVAEARNMLSEVAQSAGRRAKLLMILSEQNDSLILEEVIPAFASLYMHRRATLTNLYDYLLKNPADIPRFISWITEHGTEPDVEAVPLLTIIANDVYDKSGDHTASDFWDELRAEGSPLDFRGAFLIESLAKINIAKKISRGLGILRSLRDSLDVEEADFIREVVTEFDGWPAELKEDYRSFTDAVIDFAQKAIAKAVKGSVREDRFDPPDNTKTPRKQNVAKGGRVTPRQNTFTLRSAMAEREANREFDGLGLIIENDGSYTLEGYEREGIVALVELVSGSDPNLIADMLRVLDSVYEKPTGEGAAPIAVESKVQIWTNRTLRVWELKASNRPGIFLDTEDTDLSIKYCIARDPESGERFLGILDMSHGGADEKVELEAQK